MIRPASFGTRQTVPDASTPDFKTAISIAWSQVADHYRKRSIRLAVILAVSFSLNVAFATYIALGR